MMQRRVGDASSLNQRVYLGPSQWKALATVEVQCPIGIAIGHHIELASELKEEWVREVVRLGYNRLTVLFNATGLVQLKDRDVCMGTATRPFLDKDEIVVSLSPCEGIHPGASERRHELGQLRRDRIQPLRRIRQPCQHTPLGFSASTPTLFQLLVDPTSAVIDFEPGKVLQHTV